MSQFQLIVVGVILFALSLSFNLAIDYKKLLKEGRINHKNKWHWIRKALISSASVLFFAWALSDEVKWVWCLVFSSLMCGFVFYLLFDIGLNLLRGEKWYYLGTPDEFDSATEKIERLGTVWMWWLIKFTSALGFTYIYIKLL